MWNEKQTALLWIWTCFGEAISYDDNVFLAEILTVSSEWRMGPLQEKYILSMTFNWIYFWDTCFEDLENVEYTFIIITPLVHSDTDCRHFTGLIHWPNESSDRQWLDLSSIPGRGISKT